ncbi:chalcone isomerase family protein [Paucibacter soli]|uniref:chalcone isomerase family protein n=1 Tax=Paucibacter soli TaxID=3133433 RepID=UPI003096407D
MQRRTVLPGLAALLAWPVGRATPTPAELSGLQLQGQAQMRFFGLAVYDIRLWVKERVEARNWAEQTLALELLYARNLRGAEIAKRSLQEMRRQTEIADPVAQRWLAEMQQSFPDVKAGDRLSGLLLPQQGAQFFVNGQRGRLVADAEFARLFFGIWLSERSSEPALRAALLEAPRGRG